MFLRPVKNNSQAFFLKINPNSQLVHLALYKFYLDDNDADKAIESMKKQGWKVVSGRPIEKFVCVIVGVERVYEKESED